MPIRRYGVLKGRPIEKKMGTHKTKHYQVHVVNDVREYRIAINIESGEPCGASILEQHVNENFHHPLAEQLIELRDGFTALESKPGGLALDYIRGNVVHPHEMRPLPPFVVGPDNDLNELLDTYIERAIENEDALVYAFGQLWGPEEDRRDPYFGFFPEMGIHDIHMNQGNLEQFEYDDGIWQDGGLLLHFPSEARWIGIFLKFESQSWHTDDHTGHRIDTPTVPLEERAVHPVAHQPDLLVRVVGARVQPEDPSEPQTIVLLNTSPHTIDLDGWSLADTWKQKQRLTGRIGPGGTFEVPVKRDDFDLSMDGGIITLLNEHGLKVHGVSYTRSQAQSKGWTITFDH